MKYAVINLAGSQYKVSENQILTVDNLNLDEGKLSNANVLLVVDENKVKIGNPELSDSIVEFKILKNFQDKKIRVFKYKAKSRYQKTLGFRHQLTDIQITKINP